MKKIIFSMALATSFVFASGSTMYERCVICHGVNAEKKALGASRVIAKFSEQQIVDKLKGYKEGTYGGPMKAVMLPHVRNLSDEDIMLLAKHIQTIK